MTGTVTGKHTFNVSFLNKYWMLCYKDSHITNENKKYQISLFCLLPFYHAIWNNLLGKFSQYHKGTLQQKEHF